MSIRLRLAVAFALAVTVMFTLGSWIFADELSSSLLGSIDAQLSAQLSSASRYLVAQGQRPTAAGSPLPGEYVVQVIDAAGRVRGASADVGPAPMLSPAQLSQARTHRIMLTTTEEDERERVLAGPLPGRPTRPGWVAVTGVSLETFDTTISDVTRNLAVTGAVVIVAAGLGAYGLARAALSPVERMRREVAALSERDQGGVRVPRTRDEIAALAMTMNDLLSRLQGALRRQRALVADASHELRTPFAVLSGELELAARPGRSREELRTAVRGAAEEVTRLARITEQLLFLARSDEDRIPPRPERTSLRPLLAAAAAQAAARARAAEVSCQVDAPGDLTADLDPAQIRQAVDNLIDNALRFAPAGTAIRIAARTAGSNLVIEVSDCGPGFPPAFLAHAFERFGRPDTGRARTDGGAGLGLAIVKVIAQAHGGSAQARNQDAGGAAVLLTLPQPAARGRT